MKEAILSDEGKMKNCLESIKTDLVLAQLFDKLKKTVELYSPIGVRLRTGEVRILMADNPHFNSIQDQIRKRISEIKKSFGVESTSIGATQ